MGLFLFSAVTLATQFPVTENGEPCWGYAEVKVVKVRGASGSMQEELQNLGLHFTDFQVQMSYGLTRVTPFCH